MRSKLDSFIRKNAYLALFCSPRTAYIVRDNAKKIRSVGLPYKDVILFSKENYVIYVCVFQCQSTALLRASGTTQGG